jgi:hypothetical protein
MVLINHILILLFIVRGCAKSGSSSYFFVSTSPQSSIFQHGEAVETFRNGASKYAKNADFIGV